METRILDSAGDAHGEPAWTVVGHTSDEDGPADVGVSLTMPDGSVLWAGEITLDAWRDAGEEAAALGDGYGWWLIIYGADKASSRVLAKFVGEDEAKELIYRLAAAGMSERTP